MNHKPIPMQGNRKLVSYQIPLVNYSPPPIHLLIPSWSSPSLEKLSYHITTSKSTYGPNESLDLILNLKKQDSSLSLKKVIVTLERHLILNPVDHISSASIAAGGESGDETLSSDGEIYRTDSTTPITTTNTGENRKSLFQRSRVSISPESRSLLLPPTSPSVTSKSSTTTTILVIEKKDIVFNNDGTTRVEMGAEVPRCKSIYRYSIGESMSTPSARIEFTLSIKVSLSLPVILLGLDY